MYSGGKKTKQNTGVESFTVSLFKQWVSMDSKILFSSNFWDGISLTK